jgi:hypothetical protein
MCMQISIIYTLNIYIYILHIYCMCVCTYVSLLLGKMRINLRSCVGRFLQWYWKFRSEATDLDMWLSIVIVVPLEWVYIWNCEILYRFGDLEPLVTFWLQGTLGCTASHRGYVLAKTESVLWLFFGFVVGFPRFTVVAEPGFGRAGQFLFW